MDRVHQFMTLPGYYYLRTNWLRAPTLNELKNVVNPNNNLLSPNFTIMTITEHLTIQVTHRFA